MHWNCPIVSRSALSRTGRNSVSRNAPKPSSPSHGCSRVPPPGTGYVRLPKRASNSFISLSSPTAGERGGERDLRLEPDVDAVGGRDAQHVDADAIAAPGRARDDVAPRRALRRVQPRVLREPAGPGQAGGGRDQLPLRLLVERAAVVDDADLVRAGAREAAERHEREDDHEQSDPDRTDREPDPTLTAGLARPAPSPRQLRQLVLEGHMRNVQAARSGPTRMVASRPARVAQLVEREPSKLEVAGSRPVARFDAAEDGVRLDGSRGVAQSGSAPGWGPGGRRFKSCLPDHAKALVRSHFSKRARSSRRGDGENLLHVAARVAACNGRLPAMRRGNCLRPVPPGAVAVGSGRSLFAPLRQRRSAAGSTTVSTRPVSMSLTRPDTTTALCTRRSPQSAATSMTTTAWGSSRLYRCDHQAGWFAAG